VMRFSLPVEVESEMWPSPLESEILTPIDVADGFGLWEDEDFVYLTRHGEIVATFSAGAATKQSIQEEIARQSLAGDALRENNSRKGGCL